MTTTQYTPGHCLVVTLTLPQPRPIVTALESKGVPQHIAIRSSDHYVRAVTELSRTVLQQYQNTIEETRLAHICECPGSDSVCPESQRIAETFVKLFERRIRSMKKSTLDQVINEHKSACKPTLSMDHTPILEFAYAQSKKPSTQEKTLLAEVTGLPLKKVSTWFQNRRTREKCGTIAKHPLPQTIAELRDRLQQERRVYKAFCLRQRNDADSGNESNDSGYASAGSVPELVSLMHAFHIDDEVAAPQTRACKPKCTSRKTSGSSQGSTDQTPPSKRPIAGKPKRRTKSSISTTLDVAPSDTSGGIHHSNSVLVSPRCSERDLSAQSPHTMSPRRSSTCRQHGDPDMVCLPSRTPPQLSRASRMLSIPTTEHLNRLASDTAHQSILADLAFKGVDMDLTVGNTLQSWPMDPLSTHQSKPDTSFPVLCSPRSALRPLTTFPSRGTMSDVSCHQRSPSKHFIPQESDLSLSSREVPTTFTALSITPEISIPPAVEVAFPDLFLHSSPKDPDSAFPPIIAPDDDPRAFSVDLLNTPSGLTSLEPVCTTDDFSALLELLCGPTSDTTVSTHPDTGAFASKDAFATHPPSEVVITDAPLMALSDDEFNSWLPAALIHESERLNSLVELYDI